MLKIGIIDSGIGGFSVVKGMIDSGIVAEYYYVFDNKYHPYGGKSKGELSSIAFIHVGALVDIGVDMIVIACNTLTSSSIVEVRRMFNLPIIGVEPPIKPCTQRFHDIVIMATPFTLKGDKLHDILLEHTEDNFYYPDLEGLAGLIEDNYDDRECILNYLVGKLDGYAKCGGLVIGCTHYNFVIEIIAELLPSINIFTSTDGVVRRVQDMTDNVSIENDNDSSIYLMPTGESVSDKKYTFLRKYLDNDIIIYNA